MKRLFELIIVLLAVAIPNWAWAQDLEVTRGIAETNFDARDYLVADPYEDQFYVRGFYFNWDGGEVNVFKDSLELDTFFELDEFGNLHFFTTPAADMETNFDYIEGRMGAFTDGRAWLEVDIYYKDGTIIARRFEQVMAGYAWVVFEEICECTDKVTLTCTNAECHDGTECDSGDPNKCKMMKPARPQLPLFR